MMIINKKNNEYKSNIDCDYHVEVNEGTIKIWGKPLIYKTRGFDSTYILKYFKNSLNDIVPYMAGSFVCIWEKDGKLIEIANDYYCHHRFYYSENEDSIYLGENWLELPHTTNQLNVFQLLYFLNWDSVIGGESFFRELKYLTPTHKYQIKNNQFQSKFMPFPKIEEEKNNTLFQAIQKTLRAVHEYNENIHIMLSGGLDSSQIALAAKLGGGVDAKFLLGKIMDLGLYDNVLDEVQGACFAEKLKLNFEEVEIIVAEFLKKWDEQLPLYVPFSYKDGRLWQGIAEYVRVDGGSILINGQNADALYNYSYTGNSEYDKIMREMTTNENLEKIFMNEYFEEVVLNKWHTFHPLESITKEKFLAWCIIKGNGYKKYNGIVVDQTLTEKGKIMYDESLELRMKELIKQLDDNMKHPRELLLEGKMVGYIDGEDTRSIVGACKVNGIDSFQIYTSPLVLESLKNLKLDKLDVDTPKLQTKEIMSQTVEFQISKQFSINQKKQEMLSPSEVWDMIYKILDEKYNFNECNLVAFRLFEEMSIFDLEKLRSLRDSDIGVKMRIAWFGLIYQLFETSLI